MLSGTIDYCVNGISFAEFSFPSDKVDVEISAESIQVK